MIFGAMGSRAIVRNVESDLHDEIENFTAIERCGARAPIVSFESVWERRVARPLSPDASVWLPCLEDLILTKRFADRERDRVDIVMLEALRRTSEGEDST
jgi:hypothetical protein